MNRSATMLVLSCLFLAAVGKGPFTAPGMAATPIGQRARLLGIAPVEEPDDVRPASFQQFPDRLPALDVVPAVQTSPAEGALCVEDLVRQVLARNPSVAQMVAAQEAASARYPQVIALEDPMFGTTLAPASFGSNSVEPGYRVEVSQKLPFPGKRALRGQAADAEVSAAGRDVEDVRLQLVESARNAFYDYYLVDRALAVSGESLRLLRDVRADAEARYRNATTKTPQEVLQVNVEIGRQDERQLTLERRRRVAIARINTLMHLPPEQPLPPPPERLTPVESLPDAATLRAAALARRPDLQALSDRIRGDQAALALACRDYYPDFEATAAYDTIMGNGPTRDLAPQVGLRINVPVRNARRQAAVAEAQARLSQRRAELASRTDQVLLQVQEAYEQVLEGEKLVVLYERMILPAAQQNVGAAQPAFRTGQISLTTLIEAERNLVGLRDRYYEASADYFRRRATLERVIGGPIPPSRS